MHFDTTNGQRQGEIDIMEQWGNNYLTNSTTGPMEHVHILKHHILSNFSSYISSGSYADEFHTYSIVWKPDNQNGTLMKLKNLF